MAKRFIRSDYIDEDNQSIKENTSKNKIFSPSINDVQPIMQNKAFNPTDYKSNNSSKNKIFSPIGAENTAPSPIVPPPSINNQTFYSNKGTPITFSSNADAKAGKAGSVAAGLANGASLGIIPKILDHFQPGMSKQAEEENPVAYNIGNMAGSILPFAKGTKLVGKLPLLNKAANPLTQLIKRPIEGAIVGSGMIGIEDKLKGKSNEDTLKDIKQNAIIGGGIDLALGLPGAAKYIKGINKNILDEAFINKFGQMPNNMTEAFSKEHSLPLGLPAPRAVEAPINILPSGDTIPMGGSIEKANPLVRIKKTRTETTNPVYEKYNGKYTVKNTEMDKVQQTYDDAVKEIQNYWGHWKLDEAEIRLGAEELGIPLDDILKNMENAKTNIKSIGNNARLEKIAGVNTEIPKLSPLNKTKVSIDSKPVFSGYVDRKINNPVLPKTPFQVNTENKTIAARLSKSTGRPYEDILNELNNPQPTSYTVDPKFSREEIIPTLKTIEPNIKTMGEVAVTNPIKEELPTAMGASNRRGFGVDIVSSNENQAKTSFKDKLDNAYTRMVDEFNPIKKKVSDETHMLALNSKNSKAVVDHMLTENLVDKEGNVIGESLSNIKKDIEKATVSEEDKKLYQEYMLQRHNIDRAREITEQVPKVDKQGFLVKDKNGKQVYDTKIIKPNTAIDKYTTSQSSIKRVAEIEKEHPEWKGLQDRFVKYINTFMEEWGNKSGLVSDDAWKQMNDWYKSYIPTQRDIAEIEKGYSGSKKGFVDQSSPITKLKGTSEKDVIDPFENVMNLVNRTVKTAKYNEVGQSLLNDIRSGALKDNNAAEILKEGMDANKPNVVSVLEKGKPVNIQINDTELLKALKNINPSVLHPIEAGLKKGTGIFKGLITQYNPVFGVRNMLRDIPTAYINGSENNPIKFAKDLVKAGKELSTNGEIAQRYKAVGGGGANFFNSENTAKSAKELTKVSMPKKIIQGIEHINNIIESAPRLAEFNRILDETGDVQKALYAASDVTTNFARGGDLTKHLDSFVPYLNAGVQGLDKLARQFINKPIPTIAKGLVGITSLTMYLDHVNKDNENYQKLDNRTKDNYFLFPKEDGTFVKIPKSRELGVLFGSLFERSLRKTRGDNEAFKDYFRSGKGVTSFAKGTVGTNFSPANPLESNIFSPITNLRANKDFADRDIVPRSMLEDNRSKYLQYDEKTSEITKKIAEAIHKTGVDLSPKQMDYLIKSYTGVIGQLGLPATTKSKGSTGSKILKPITSQFIADPVYSNQVLSNFYDNYDTIKTKSADKNILEKIPSKVLTKEEKQKSIFTKASTDISKLNKEIRTAEFNNDLDKVRSLRIKMLEAAYKANNQYKK